MLKVIKILKQRYPYHALKDYLSLVGITLAALFIIKFNSAFGFIPSIFLFIFFCGLLFVLFCFLYERLAFYMSLAIPFLMFPLQRFLNQDLPLGVMQHSLILLLLIIMLVKKITNNDYSFAFLRNPITNIYLLLIAYLFIQGLNPNMDSIVGWAIVIRFTLASFLTYLCSLYLFKDLKFLEQFFTILIIISTIAAIYGIKQELVGFADFEMRWIKADEFRFKRIYVMGKFRKFSVLSDPSTFGMLMAALCCFTIMFSFNYKGLRKYFYWICAGLMLVAMGYSGTRTSYAMILAAVIIYVLMRITKIQTVVFLIFFVLSFIILMFGPFYGGKTISRMRTTFNSDDPSLNVRDVNRKLIQPYIYEHPIGGGLMTTRPQARIYNPDHVLANFPPDNGYLKIALEQGYIGLIIQMSLLFISLRVGIKNYYRSGSKNC